MGPSNLAAALRALTGHEPVRSTGDAGSEVVTVRLDPRRVLCVDPAPGHFGAIVCTEDGRTEGLDVVSEPELLRVVAAFMAGTSAT